MKNIDPAFHGIARLYGQSAFAKIQNAHVCVIGIGGVGSWTVEALARSGVGEITLIDLDDICITNTNRQLHTTLKTVGKMKVQVMKDRVLAINPACKVNAVEDFLTADNVSDLISPKMDYVIDAIDSLQNKCIIIDFCRNNKISALTTGGAGGLQDPFNFHATDLNLSFRDKLLMRVRKKLKRDFNYPREKEPWGIDAVFSSDHRFFPAENGETCRTIESDTNLKLDCQSGLGTASFVTGTLGFYAASFAIKRLIEK